MNPANIRVYCINWLWADLQTNLSFCWSHVYNNGKRKKMFLEIHCSPIITLCLESIGKYGDINESCEGVQWLSGRVLDLRLRGCRFEPHWRHCIVSLSKTLYPLLNTGSTQEDSHYRKIVNWDVKNRNK